jgi:hypothetical protein
MSTVTDREAWSARRSKHIDDWGKKNPAKNFSPRSSWWKAQLKSAQEWEKMNPPPPETKEERAQDESRRESANNFLGTLTGRR